VLAALLAIASSCCYGGSDFLAGLQSRRRSVWSIMAVSQPAALFVAVVIVAVRRVPVGAEGPLLVAVLGGVALAGAALLYYTALASGTMCVVAPVANAGVLLPVLVGLATGEAVNLLQSVGIGLAVGGILLSSRAEARCGGTASVRSVLLAAGSAACFGVVMVALDIGGREDVYWSVLGLRLGATVTILVYLAVRRPRLHMPRRALPVLAAVGLFAMAANLLFTAATTVGHLSVVSVLGSLSPVVVAVFAGGVLHERLSTTQLGAALVVFVGVVVLAAA
jgi:drug/metabolite transporter (DMT)-like permease